MNTARDVAGDAVDAVEGAWHRLSGKAADNSGQDDDGNSQEAGGSETPRSATYKGYPDTLKKAQYLIGQVSKYDQKHATLDDVMSPAVEKLWCSGLSNWSLNEAGYDIMAKHPYQPTDPKTGKPTGETKSFSIDQLVEGNVVGKQDPYVAYAQEGMFGESPEKDNLLVKGAVAAFIIAGIGYEIHNLKDVKPGDFIQERDYRSPDGHAFQIYACLCEGEAFIGPSGSPALKADLGGGYIQTAKGVWLAKAQFEINGNTDPAYVGRHEVVKHDRFEANVKGKVMEDAKKKDTGGVQVRHGQTFSAPKKEGGQRTYIGRLNDSSWAGFDPKAPALVRPEGEFIQQTFAGNVAAATGP